MKYVVVSTDMSLDTMKAYYYGNCRTLNKVEVGDRLIVVIEVEEGNHGFTAQALADRLWSGLHAAQACDTIEAAYVSAWTAASKVKV